jgi:hypothetical protein
MNQSSVSYSQFDYNLDRFNFTIESEGLRIRRKRLSESTETFVRFEDIGTKRIKEGAQKWFWLLASMFFIIVTVWVFSRRMKGADIGDGAEIFWLSVSLVLFIVYIITRKRILYIAAEDNTDAIEFVDRKAYSESLEEFIQTLIQRRNEFLMEKYFKIDDLMSYDSQYNNFVWLHSLKLITRDQLAEKVSELDHMNDTRGFRKRGDESKIKGFIRDDYDEESEDEDEDEEDA